MLKEKFKMANYKVCKCSGNERNYPESIVFIQGKAHKSYIVGLMSYSFPVKGSDIVVKTTEGKKYLFPTRSYKLMEDYEGNYHVVEK